MKIKRKYIILSMMVVMFFVVPGILLAIEPVKMTKQVSFEREWRLGLQNANKATREFQKYNRRNFNRIATKIAADLKSNENTMIAAEKLLKETAVNRQARKLILSDLYISIRNLEKSIDEIKQQRGGETTAFENFDQKADQLLNILSIVLKNTKEMADGIIRNLN